MYSTTLAAWLRAVCDAFGSAPRAMSMSLPERPADWARASLSESLSGAPRACGERSGCGRDGPAARRARGVLRVTLCRAESKRGSGAHHPLEALRQPLLRRVGREQRRLKLLQVEQDLHALVALREEGSHVEAHGSPHRYRDAVSLHHAGGRLAARRRLRRLHAVTSCGAGGQPASACPRREAAAGCREAQAARTTEHFRDSKEKNICS